jgi:hypothetical protein
VKIEQYIEDVMPISTNTEPRINKLHFTATGNYQEIQWLNKKINEMLANPVENRVSLQKAEDEDYKKVYEKYGKTHLIEKRMGTKIDMTKLKDDESVCWGDGKSYHYLLTKK